MIGKVRTLRGRQWRRISCFLLFFSRSVFLFLSLSSASCLNTGLSAQHSKTLGVFVLLGDAAFLSWAFSLAPASGQSKGKKQDCEIIPLLHNLCILRGFAATCIWLLICPFTSFLSCCAVDIGLLLLVCKPTTLSQERMRERQDRTLILNPLRNLYRELFSSFSYLILVSTLTFNQASHISV